MNCMYPWSALNELGIFRLVDKSIHLLCLCSYGPTETIVSTVLCRIHYYLLNVIEYPNWFPILYSRRRDSDYFDGLSVTSPQCTAVSPQTHCSHDIGEVYVRRAKENQSISSQNPQNVTVRPLEMCDWCSTHKSPPPESVCNLLPSRIVVATRTQQPALCINRRDFFLSQISRSIIIITRAHCVRVVCAFRFWLYSI